MGRCCWRRRHRPGRAWSFHRFAFGRRFTLGGARPFRASRFGTRSFLRPRRFRWLAAEQRWRLIVVLLNRRPAVTNRSRRPVDRRLPRGRGRRGAAAPRTSRAQKCRQRLCVLDAGRVMLPQETDEFVRASAFGKAASTLVTNRATGLKQFGSGLPFIEIDRFALIAAGQWPATAGGRAAPRLSNGVLRCKSCQRQRRHCDETATYLPQRPAPAHSRLTGHAIQKTQNRLVPRMAGAYLSNVAHFRRSNCRGGRTLF